MGVLTAQQARRARVRGASRPGRPAGEQLRLEAAPALRARPASPAAPCAPGTHTAPVAPTDRAVLAPEARGAAQRPHTGPTLDDVLVGVWEGLGVGEEVACPVCRAGTLVPEAAGGGRARSIVGCDACASRLAR